MKNNTAKKIGHIVKPFPYVVSFIILILTLVVIPETAIRIYYKDKISQNIYLQGINISGFDKSQFTEFLTNYYKDFSKITVDIDRNQYRIALSDINYSIDYENSWRTVYQLKKNYLYSPLTPSIAELFKRQYFDPLISYDKQILLSEIEKISTVASIEPAFEKITLSDQSVSVSPGKDGAVVNKEQLKKLVSDAMQRKSTLVSISLDKVNASIPQNQRQLRLEQANNLIGKSLSIGLGADSYEISDKDLVETLNDGEENNFEYINALSDKITILFNREAKNSVLVFENGKVTEFTPSEDGIIVDKDALEKEITDKRSELASTDAKEINIPLPHQKIHPEVTTGDINNLGIKEKIGSGYSTFKGSATSRMYNIKLASSKFNGVLIAPGETMSFNKTLGDVSKVTGYQQAYIIKDGQTILGDGGGVCQVSTTLFRAALNAGLPIVERRSHSYRVSYYEQGFPPGLDATVFDPTTDLKIKNGTDNYILIQTTFNEKNKKLTFDLYGTADGRVATIGKSIITNTTPPPDDLYIDDPTLKTGVVKQIDYKAWGAKVYFNYTVEKNGLIIYEKIFYSNFQPWQAKFLRGTGT